MAAPNLSLQQSNSDAGAGYRLLQYTRFGKEQKCASYVINVAAINAANGLPGKSIAGIPGKTM